MTITDKLTEQHFKEYESRLKHLDELYKHAQKKSASLDEGHPLRQEFGKFHEQYNELVEQTTSIEKMHLSQWREDMVQSAGPMAIWDIFAQKLEDFIERVEN